MNLIPHENNWLRDENDSTCNVENSTVISSKLKTENYFTWMRLTFKENDLIKKFSLEFNTSTSVVHCINQKLSLVNNNTIEVWCSLNILIQEVNIIGEGVRTLCSIYVSGGRNVALKQPTNQTSTYVNVVTPSSISLNAVDGNIDGQYEDGSCTHTAPEDPSPTWTVNFNETFAVNRFVLYNRGNTENNSNNQDTLNKERLKHFILKAFGENSEELLNYKDNNEIQSIYTINKFISDRVASVTITATTLYYGVILTLCEVEIFGDCPDGKRGLKCDQECNKEVNVCNRVCFGATDPPDCNKMSAKVRNFTINGAVDSIQLNANDTAELSCDVEGIPEPKAYLNGSELSIIRDFTSNRPSVNYTLTGLTCRDAGRYFCYGLGNGTISNMSHVDINITCKPQLAPSESMYENKTKEIRYTASDNTIFTIQIYGYPEPKEFILKVEINNVLKNATVEHKITYTKLTPPFGLVTVKINDANTKGSTTYNLDIKNDAGTVNVKFNVIKEDPPSTTISKGIPATEIGIGIGVGCGVLLIATIIVVTICIVRRRRANLQNSQPAQYVNPAFREPGPPSHKRGRIDMNTDYIN